MFLINLCYYNRQNNLTMYNQASIIMHQYCNIYNESVIFIYYAYPTRITTLTD